MNYIRVITVILLIILLQTILFGCNNSSNININSLNTDINQNNRSPEKITFSLISSIYDSETFSPIGGATVKINDSLNIYADSKGIFHIKDFNTAEDSKIKIDISSPNYITNSFYIKPENNSEIHSEFLLYREKTDLSGKITLNSNAFECNITIGEKNVNTRKDGSFNIKSVYCGENIVKITRNNRIYIEKTFVFEKDQGFFELELSDFSIEKNLIIKNIITDEQDYPISGILIYSSKHKWITDENGKFEFEVREDIDSIKLTFVDPSKKYIDKIENLKISQQKKINVIKLKKIISEKESSKISGMIFSKSRKIHNSLIMDFKNPLHETSAQIQNDGWFNVELPEGKYILTVKDPDNIFATHTQDITVSEDSEYLSISLTPKN